LRFDRERIRALSPIEEIIGEDVELRRRGRYLVGLCPFHPDRHPSFTVSPDRQTFRCFGCGERGDIFAYVMARDGISFRQALRVLAQRAGLHAEPVTRLYDPSGIVPSRLWPPSRAERRRSDRNLAEAYAEVELRLAESLRQRWVEAHRKLREAGVDLDQFTSEDWNDGCKMEALAAYYAALNLIGRDEQLLEGIARRRCQT